MVSIVLPLRELEQAARENQLTNAEQLYAAVAEAFENIKDFFKPIRSQPSLPEATARSVAEGPLS
jgi:hypothetical protein